MYVLYVALYAATVRYYIDGLQSNTHTHTRIRRITLNDVFPAELREGVLNMFVLFTNEYTPCDNNN